MNRASALQLPWSLANDDARFKKILIALLAVYLMVSLSIIFIKVPELTRAEKEQLPPQLARIMLEKQELPSPNPIQPKTIEKVKPEEAQPGAKKIADKKPEKNIAEQKKVVTLVVDKSEQPIAQNPVKDSKQSNEAAIVQAREKAATSGLMQFKDDLADMRESLQTAVVASASTTTPVSAATGAAVKMDHSLINSGVSKDSGGVNATAYNRDTGGTALAGRAATKVKSELAEASKKAAGATAAGGGNSNGTGGAARSEEEVRAVMEKHKGALFNIYNKALRDDATLQGEVRVKLVIDPDGRIVDATIVSSALKSPELETKILQRIKLITFSASSVIRTTLNYSFNFLPQ